MSSIKSALSSFPLSQKQFLSSRLHISHFHITATSDSSFYSFDAMEMLHGSSILDLNKKRKLQPELFSLPMPKHTCLSWDSTPSSSLEGYPELGHLEPLIIARVADEDSRSYPKSAEGSSSSLMEDSGLMVSLSSELQALPSSLNVTCTYNNSLGNQTYFSNDKDAKEMETRAKEDINPLHIEGPINLRQILEEQLLEFRTHKDYNGNDLMEQYGDSKTEDEIYSGGMNSSSYVLSSGTWNIERGIISMNFLLRSRPRSLFWSSGKFFIRLLILMGFVRGT